jgi:mono/diheme cytochrome c family protein
MVKAGLMLISALVLAATGAWAQADSALIAKGETTFVDKKCILCHAIKGKGGTGGPLARGPDLSTVGAQRGAEWLKAFMKDPKAVNPKAKMMAFKGTEEELEALVAYLGSLK